MELKKIRPINIAHRGARSLAPENTLAAARKARELGADWWELDVAVTADQQLVILHDDTLERTSNVAEIFPDRQPYEVHRFTLAELRQLDFGSWFNRLDPFGQIAAGQVTPAEQQSFIGEPIPTLLDALTFTRAHGWSVNVEIKDASQTPNDGMVVGAVVATIGALDMQAQVLVSSFNHAYIRQVKQLDQQIRTGALVEEAVDDPVTLLKQTRADAYNPGLGLIQPDEIELVRQAGYDVFIWTVNEVGDMLQLIQAGASGLFTDFPQRLNEILDKEWPHEAPGGR